jgi:GNAT superfamily N-acetyltransferase
VPLTLIPLTLHDHTDLLQAVYDATPGYWHLFGLDAAPPYQAIQTLRAAGETPGRAIFGILHPVKGSNQYSAISNQDADADTGETPATDPLMTDSLATDSLIPEMIGVIDIHLHHPERGVTTVGMVMLAEEWQRQGHGSAAWALVEAWLAGSAGIAKVRAGVEAFNPGALRFFQSLGFHLTGEATRVQVGEQLVRVIHAEKTLTAETA